MFDINKPKTTNWLWISATLLLILFLGQGCDNSSVVESDTSISGAPTKPIGFEHYSVEPTADGYLISGLPSEVIEAFPGPHKIQVILDDGVQGRTQVSGLATRIGSSALKVSTEERLSFLPVPKQTWLLTKSLEGEPNADGAWSGCPRDSNMAVYIDDSICWCYSDPGTFGGDEDEGKPEFVGE